MDFLQQEIFTKQSMYCRKKTFWYGSVVSLFSKYNTSWFKIQQIQEPNICRLYQNTQINIFFIIFSSPWTGWVIWAQLKIVTYWQGNTGRQLFIEPIHRKAEKKLIKLKWCHKALRYWEQIDCCRLYKHKHWRLIFMKSKIKMKIYLWSHFQHPHRFFEYISDKILLSGFSTKLRLEDFLLNLQSILEVRLPSRACLTVRFLRYESNWDWERSTFTKIFSQKLTLFSLFTDDG